MDSLKAHYEEKLQEIMKIPAVRYGKRINIPVGNYINEARLLYRTCRTDKEELTAAALDWSIVEDLPKRIDALEYAQLNWAQIRLQKDELTTQLAAKVPELKQTYARFLHFFRYAYENNQEVNRLVSSLKDTAAIPVIVQSLRNLIVSGRQSPAELQAVNFDLQQLDAAEKLTLEVEALRTKWANRDKHIAAKCIRDQARVYVKEVVDVIRRCGRFVYWHDAEKKGLYVSEWLRQKRREKKKRKKEEGVRQ